LVDGYPISELKSIYGILLVFGNFLHFTDFHQVRYIDIIR
jgi:hypothetical protein